MAFGRGGAVAGYTAMLINRAKGAGVAALSNGAPNPAAIAQRALDLLSK